MNVGEINKINASGKKVYLAITGGGQSFLGHFMSIEGASNTIVGADIPYSKSAFDDFAGKEMDSYASEEAARRLAYKSFRRCLKYGCERENSIGIGATCSLAKQNEREGREHKIIVAFHTAKQTVVFSAFLVHGRCRAEEEHLASNVIWNVLKYAVLGENQFDGESIKKYLFMDTETCEHIVWKDDHVSCLYNGQLNAVWEGFGTLEDNLTMVFYSGSFNPLHQGHKDIYEMSQKVLGIQPILELSVVNADKGELDYCDISFRRDQMKGYPYVITSAPTFVKKAHLFHHLFPDKDLVFIVGMDTWGRIWDTKYAGPTATVFNHLVSCRARFLVFPRCGPQLNIPLFAEDLRVRSRLVDCFHSPYSSRQIRSKKN